MGLLHTNECSVQQLFIFYLIILQPILLNA